MPSDWHIAYTHVYPESAIPCYQEHRVAERGREENFISCLKVIFTVKKELFKLYHWLSFFHQLFKTLSLGFIQSLPKLYHGFWFCINFADNYASEFANVAGTVVWNKDAFVSYSIYHLVLPFDSLDIKQITLITCWW